MKHGLTSINTSSVIRNLILAACFGASAIAGAATSPTSSKVAAAVATSAPLPAGVVAKVNDVAITQEQLDQAVRASGAADTPQLRANLKNQLVARELFRQVALKAHYDTHADVQAAVEQAKTVAMTQAYLRDNVKARSSTVSRPAA